MRKFAGLGSQIRVRLQALGYWKNGRPAVLRFCADKHYRPQYVYAWLKNRVPSHDNLRRLAHDLGVSMAWIMFGAAGDEPSPARPEAAAGTVTEPVPVRPVVHGKGPALTVTRSRREARVAPGTPTPGKSPPPAAQIVDLAMIDLARVREVTDKLVRLEAALTAVFEAFPDLYLWLDADGTLLSYRVGRGFRLSLVLEPFLGKRLQEAFLDTGDQVHEAFRQALETNSLVTIEHPLTLEDAEHVYEARFVPLNDRPRKDRNVLVIVRDITRRKRAEEATKVLVEVGHELAGTLDLAQAANRVVSAVFRLFRARYSVLYQLEPASGSLIGVAAAGAVRAEDWVGRTLPAGTGIAGLAVAERKPVWTSDVFAERRVALPTWLVDRMQHEGDRAAIGVPLAVRDRMLGALVLADSAGRVFTEDEVQLLSAFGDQAALALQNARLYAEAEERQRAAEIVAKLARTINSSLDLEAVLQRVVDGAKELCGSDLAYIALPDPGSQIFTLRYLAGAQFEESWIGQIAPGKGVGGQVLVTERPFRTDNYAEDHRISKDYLASALAEGILAELAVPIRVGERIEGLLFVANRAARPFADEDEAALVELADHAGIAIRNARLYAESEQRRRAAERLAERAQIRGER